MTGDIGDNFGVELTQIRDFLLNKAVNARILQADTVENAHRRLRNARRRIAELFLRRQTLGADTAQLTEIVKIGIFMTETERTGSSRHRVFELNPAKIYTKICHYHCTSLESNTGPSLQT